MKQENIEVWKSVAGYEEFYAVSNLGRIKSLERTVIRGNGRKYYVKERILKPIKNKKGYLYVELCKNGKGKSYLVHRLVAEAFIPNPCPEKYDVVNHKIEGDEGKLINTVENLEWCDIPYNNAYGTGNERRAKANSKTVYQYSKDTHELVQEWQSVNEVQRQMGWNSGHISQCCRGERKSCHGFVWSYTPLV